MCCYLCFLSSFSCIWNLLSTCLSPDLFFQMCLWSPSLSAALFIDWFIRSLIDWLIASLILWFIDWFIDYFTDWSIDSLIASLILWFIHWLIYRSYWVVDMAWTYDDLLLAIINAQGSVSLVQRLGEPALIEARGCDIDLGPNLFLPLHPLISVQ